MKALTTTPAAIRHAETIAGLLASTSDLNEIVARMRALGLNKIDSIKLLRDSTGMPLGRAKDIVHLSRAWADRLESDNRLHDLLDQATDMTP